MCCRRCCFCPICTHVIRTHKSHLHAIIIMNIRNSRRGNRNGLRIIVVAHHFQPITHPSNSTLLCSLNSQVFLFYSLPIIIHNESRHPKTMQDIPCLQPHFFSFHSPIDHRRVKKLGEKLFITEMFRNFIILPPRTCCRESSIEW